MSNEQRKCQKCEGKGYFSDYLMNPGTKTRDFYTAITCDVPGCNNGIMDLAENYRILWGKPWGEPERA